MTDAPLTTVEIEPEGAARASVIWMHGLGADGSDFEPLVPQLRLPPRLPVRFVFPQAPVRPVTALTAARRQIDKLDARLLLQYATGCSHADLLALPETPVIAPAYTQFMAWVERRAAGEPLAYLVGEAEFRGRVFLVSPAVLIPRPETEVQIDLALTKLQDMTAPKILDLGAGSGIIAISLALESPAATLLAVDLSTAAISVARTNAGRLGARVDFRHSDWFTPLAGERFDLIVSNPPYVAAADPHLAGEGLPGRESHPYFVSPVPLEVRRRSPI